MKYLNQVKKEKNQYLRIADVDSTLVDLKTEAKVMNMLGFNAFINEDGDLVRDWVDGEMPTTLTEDQKQLLVYEIEKIHLLPAEDIKAHDWKQYYIHVNQLTKDQAIRFDYLVEKYQNKSLVVSHNDLNLHNILWDGEKIIPIDFEWCNLNHPYFDYVQFFIATGITLNGDFNPQVWDEILELTLYYFIMWTFEMPQVDEIFKWRDDYQNLIRLYINGDI